MARTVAAKAALASRIDALGDSDNVEVGIQARAALEKKMKFWNEGLARKLAGSGRTSGKFDKYENRRFVILNVLFCLTRVIVNSF